MGDLELDDGLRRSLVGAWHQYLVALDPIRPDLFRYCRQLTGNLWDAEDLVQETLLKAFAKLSQILYTIKSPRAYVLRTATNLWFDILRARAAEKLALTTQASDGTAGSAAGPAPSEGSELRDAAAILVERLAPQERAAFLLVELFGMSLEETAAVLGTSLGATKSALHRGRDRLKNDEKLPKALRPRPPRALLDRFVERYNARDLPGLLALMRDDAAIEMHGFEAEIAREGFERERGWFHHNFYNPFDGSPTNGRWKVATFEDEPVVLVFGGIADENTLTSVMRIEGEGDRVHRIRVYALCPDVVREVGACLGLPTQTMGYRFPFDVSAQS
jgi:RNA polymerase sigma-70 factor (ECF subfamily)